MTRGGMGMSAEVHGGSRLNGGLLQVGESFREEKTGLMTGTRVEKVEEWMIPDGLRAIGSPHPIFSGMVVVKRNYVRGKGGVWDVTYDYEGVPLDNPNWDYYEAVTEIIGGVGEEDIRLHPKFSSLAGKLGDEKNGARFDKDGRFQGFFGEAAGDLQGVEKYLISAVTVTETQIGKNGGGVVADLPKLGNPSGGPALGGGANWMLVDVQQTKRGTVWETKKVYRASGRGGWNKKIYS